MSTPLGRVAYHWAAVLSLTATACISPASPRCADGRLCPATKLCAPAGGCATPEALLACSALRAGAPCSLSAGTGRCRDGVCVLGAGCGDGVLDEGERCDDGNTRSGDGCRADCSKLELCGDRFLDEGETCDDGNVNPADGCDSCRSTEWVARAVVGSGGTGTAADVGVAFPRAVAADRLGNLYFAEETGHRIRRVDVSTGIVTTVAGTGAPGDGGDGGIATSASLHAPYGVAVDGLGHLYIAEWEGHRIRRVDALTGIISTIAGTGSPGAGGDGGPARLAGLDRPTGVVVDGLGQLYIADTFNHRVRRVDPTSGVITTVAGTGAKGYSGDDGAATLAQLSGPSGLAVDAAGQLYIADTQNQRIRRVNPSTGVIVTIAGDGVLGAAGDGGAALLAELNNPSGVTLDAAGRLYVADTGNHRIRRVDLTSGTITAVAGNGNIGYAGDGGAATEASFNSPAGVAVDGRDHIAIADTANNAVRRVDVSTGLISNIAGTGSAGYTGDGGAATSARLLLNAGVAVDPAGHLYIADTFRSRIRRVDSTTGIVTTVAGSGTDGDAGDGGPATLAQLKVPASVALDGAGRLYITDQSNHRVRRVDPGTGLIAGVAGTGASGFSGDGGPATSAKLYSPYDAVADAAGNVYIADTFNQRIRRVDAGSGLITTIAGTGIAGFTGDNGAATSAQLRYPHGLAIDGLGNLYFADTDNHRIRRVDAGSGVITSVAGIGTLGFSGDGGAATLAQLTYPLRVVLDPLGNLYIADTTNHRIRRVAAGTGLISTVAGAGTVGSSGDGGQAAAAQLNLPSGLALDKLGRLYISDTYNHRVRRADLGTGRITTIAGQVDPEGMGPVTQAHLADPQALVETPSFTLVAGGSSGTLQAVRSTTGWVEVEAGRYAQNAPGTASFARFRDASFGSIGGVAYDAQHQRIYLSETSAHRLHVITVVDSADEESWTIAPLAGDALATPGYADGAAASARFAEPTGLFLDVTTEVLLVADSGNHVVRAIDLSAGLAAATVSTLAGTPQLAGFSGDEQPATGARLSRPLALTRSSNGDLFIADTGNHRVRRVAAATGLISTVLGNGIAASSGQGTPASGFPVDNPRGLACDALGNLFVSSRTAVRLLPAGDSGVVDGTGAVQSIFGAAPRSSFPASLSACLTGLVIVDGKTVQLTDSCTGMLIELSRQIRP